MIDYPNILDKIFDKLLKNNIKIIIIGGYIRDFFLNIESLDIDIELYNVSSFEKLKNLLSEFGDINSVGKSFGVCKLKYENLFLDFTLPRVDSKKGLGHSGFDIKIEKNLDFISATKRRDFTINTIAYDVAQKKILDPFNGIADLNSKVLKMVDRSTFADDPLRVLRAVQFCARFDLKVHKELFLLSKEMVDKNLLDELPKERIYEEIKKLLLKSTRPSVGFKLLERLGALKYFGVCKSSFRALDEMAKVEITNKKTKEVLMLATLCYDLKSEQITKIISNLTNDKKLLSSVIVLVKNLDREQKQLIDYELYKLATLVNIQEISYLNRVIFKSDDTLFKRAKKLNILNKKMPNIIKGRDLIELGLKPSPLFSKILDEAYEAQMKQEFFNHRDALIWLKESFNL